MSPKTIAAGNGQDDLQSLSRVLAADLEGFKQLSILVTHLTGVRLTNIEKDYALMANRICPIMFAYGLKSYQDYLALIGEGNPVIVKEFISVMTTHTTQFFRERVQINHFMKILPDYLKMKKESFNLELRIWCAACSTGQEPYSLAFALRDVVSDFSNWDIKFLATDIDHAALEKAASGRYSKAEIVSLPEQYQKLHVRQVSEGETEVYEVSRQIQSMIRFAPFNLLDRKYIFQHEFDFIFCRNVLYYFGQFDAERAAKRLESVLAPKGFLFVGTNESGYIKLPNLERSGPAIYRKKPVK